MSVYERIVYANREDISQIMSVMDAAYAAIGHPDWYLTDDEAFMEHHIEEEGYTLKCIVSKEDNQIVAFLTVRHPMYAQDNLGRYFLQQDVDILVQPEEDIVCIDDSMVALSQIAHMESVAVDPAYRGRGLHRKLLRAAEEIERSRGTKCLMATVHPDNIFSLGNFEKEGYLCLMETIKYGGLRRKIMYKVLDV